MTNEQVLSEWRQAFGTLSGIVCESCGKREAEYTNASGDVCGLCAESAIEYGRTHMPESYED